MSSARYLSTEEAADYLGITVHALRMSLHRGHLRPTGRIGQRLLFSRDDLDRQIQQNLQNTSVGEALAANDDVECSAKRARRKPRKSPKTPQARRQTPKTPTPMSSIRASLDADRKSR